MAGQMFALIIGVDKYQSGHIWNLSSSTSDASSVEHWLVHDLRVPRGNICTLLDSHATKANIEDKFMSHLANNPSVEPGDALLIYFAGHGSSIRAPPGWSSRTNADVPVICPYDYDTKLPSGYINPGISDRSLHAMLRHLAQLKGNNITLILDTCFSRPSNDSDSPKERHYVRFTPARKAKGGDLLAGLWPSATPDNAEPVAHGGFTAASTDSHVVLAACGAGWPATERKDGGNLTRALMALKDSRPLHRITYAELPHELAAFMGDHQHAACAGANAHRVIFDGVPFRLDTRFIAATIYDNRRLQIDAGAIHGVSAGTEFALYAHNRRGSLNIPFSGGYVATEVFPTWCLAEQKTSGKEVVRSGWAKITRWNNEATFRGTVKPSFFSLRRYSLLAPRAPSRSADVARSGGVRIVRARSSRRPNVVVRMHVNSVATERRDSLISGPCSRPVRAPDSDSRTDSRASEMAARFDMHLHRESHSRPFAKALSMELFELDSSWRRKSGNLLVDGHAELVDDRKASIYAVVLHNNSDVDLWPYLVYLDAGGYSISMLYHPDPRSTTPPLRRHSHLLIGSGKTASEALSFALADGVDRGGGFLKLFVSTAYTSMAVLEQGATTAPISQSGKPSDHPKVPKVVPSHVLWDTLLASITLVRDAT